MSSYWSLDDRLMYLFHTHQLETPEFLTYLEIYGKERIDQTYLKYKAQGNSYVPKPPTGYPQSNGNSNEKPKTIKSLSEEPKQKKKVYSRYHATDSEGF